MTKDAPLDPSAAPPRLGRVVEVHGILATVALAREERTALARDAECEERTSRAILDGERLRCRLPRDRTTPVVGDVVDVTLDPRGEARITVVHARERVFARMGPNGPMPIAASVDRLVIVTAAHPGPRLGLIDRMAIACDPGVPILIVLNKDDMPEVAAARALLADHTAQGWPILTTSAATGAGVEALRETLGDGISVLVGHSGVGKSTLVNRLVPGARLLTGDVHDTTGKGRHTTTVTTVHVMNAHALVVDTPGVRAFPLDGMPLTRIAERFPGLGEVVERCHFAGCLHEGEPGCAVADAVAAGSVPAARVQRWHQLLAALREEDAQAPARTRRARQAGGTAGGGSKGPPPRQRR